MSTTTAAPTIHLVQSMDGLMAEVSDLPAVGGPEYLAHALKYEAAAEALHAQYPELVIKQSCVEDSFVVFWVEHR